MSKHRVSALNDRLRIKNALHSRWFLIIVVACLASAAVAAWEMRANDPLRRIQRSQRASEPRLSGFDYAPYRATSESDVKTRVAAAAIAKRFAEDPSDTSVHELGLAQLATGRMQDAVETLERAARARPGDPRVASDLAAAQLAMGEVAQGADTAARAVEQDPGFNEAVFNYALALEQLAIPSEARKAWKRYLDLDAVSGWSAEARQHLQSLNQSRVTWDDAQLQLSRGAPAATAREIVARYPMRTRYWIQDEVLPHWAATENASDLDTARRVASARRAAGDPFLEDVVEHAAAHALDVRTPLESYAAARKSAQERQMEAAAPLYERAIAELRRAGSPLFLAATLFAASNDFYRSHYDGAQRYLDSVDDQLARYPGLRAESGWIRSMILARMADGREIDVLKSARAAAVSGGEWEHVLGLDMLLVSAADRNGEAREGDRFRLEVLRRLAQGGAPSARTATFFARCALSSLHLERPRVALAFVSAMLDVPIVRKDPLLLADAEAIQAQALLQLARPAAAASAIARSRDAARNIPTPAIRDRVLSDVDFLAGVMETPVDPTRAEFWFTTALQTWERYGWRIRTARGFLARGDVYRARHDNRAAEADYREGILRMEEQRRTFTEPEFRVASFEDAADLFSRLIELLVEQHRYEEAFDIAERRRARWLLDHLSVDTPAEPLGARDIASRLGEREALIQFAVLPAGVSIWLVLPGRVLYAHSPASGPQVSEIARRYTQGIVRHDPVSVRADRRWLFDQLIAPVTNDIPAGSTITLVPDGDLHAVPFAAVQSGDGRYLVQIHPILYAPSATTFVRSRSIKRQTRNVLTASAPEAGPELARLNEADAETAAIAAMYNRSTLLRDSSATPGSFIDHARDADVIHFAGHARSDALLFGPDAGSQTLQAREIAEATFHSHPLVVLAACSTARGHAYRNEGIDSLALAFLHAGARGVVATLWDAEDRSASRFARALHLQLRDGVPPAEALQRVQLSMIASPSPEDKDLAAWAGVILIGRG